MIRDSLYMFSKDTSIIDLTIRMNKMCMNNVQTVSGGERLKIYEMVEAAVCLHLYFIWVDSA